MGHIGCSLPTGALRRTFVRHFRKRFPTLARSLRRFCRRLVSSAASSSLVSSLCLRLFSACQTDNWQSVVSLVGSGNRLAGTAVLLSRSGSGRADREFAGSRRFVRVAFRSLRLGAPGGSCRIIRSSHSLASSVCRKTEAKQSAIFSNPRRCFADGRVNCWPT